MALNSIGNKSFTVLLGNPQSITESLEVLKRPGVDGFGVRRTGSRGEPFELISKTDFPSGVLGRVSHEQYVAMVGVGRHVLIWEGIAFDSPVIVLGVEQQRLKVASCIAGGINVAAGASGAILEAKWKLAFSV